MKKIILAAMLAATSFRASAFDIVFDPTNFIQTATTAIYSVAMEARQAAQQATQLQQYSVQLQQQIALGKDAMLAPFGEVMDTYKTVRKYQAELEGLQGAVADVKSIMDNRMRLLAASGLSPEQYIKRERDALKYRQDSNTIMSTYERQVMDNAAQRYAQVQALQPKIAATQGTHQSMQLMNGQMNMLTASMQDFISLSAADGNRRSIETAEKQAREQRSIDADEAYQQLRDKQQAEGWATVEKLKTMDLGVRK